MHKPGHLRDAFVDLVEEGETDMFFFNQLDKQAGFENMDADDQLWWLSGQLWNCTDCLPSNVCDDLDMPTGSSYAQAARLIRQR
jgi:hypothetical protein